MVDPTAGSAREARNKGSMVVKELVAVSPIAGILIEPAERPICRKQHMPWEMIHTRTTSEFISIHHHFQRFKRLAPGRPIYPPCHSPLMSTVADEWANTVAPANPTTVSTGQKKPRHRHAPEQLVALNELFEKDEHPPLDVRSALAERLGMETKTVNAWFQNKRASSKKRTRTTGGGDRANSTHPNTVASSSPTVPTAPTSTTASTPSEVAPPPLPPLSHLTNEDEYLSSRIQHPVPSKMSFMDLFNSTTLPTFVTQPDYSGLSSGRTTPDGMSKKMRMRPSGEQTEELKKAYNSNPHPTAEERQALADRVGMRYQSVTNWFQNQRSLAKRRKEDGDGGLDSRSSSPDGGDSLTYHRSSSNGGSGSGSGGDISRQYSAFPPPPPHSMHPSLMTPFPNPNALAKSASASRGRRSESPSNETSTPARAARRSVTPYSSAMSTRPRRSRPEPYQLDALKVLFTRTATPTIEERSALALEIGMEVGKVTNWFRNLRQTARKRGSRLSDADQDGTHSGVEEDLDGLDADEMSPFSSIAHSNSESRSASRSRHGSPPRSASEDSSNMDVDMDRRPRPRHLQQSTRSRDDEGYSSMNTPARRRSPSPTILSEPRNFGGRDLPARRQSFTSPPPRHLQTHRQDDYGYRSTAASQYQSGPPSGPVFPQSHSHHLLDHPRELSNKTHLPPLMSKEPPPHLRDVQPYRQAAGAAADISFGRFSASVSIFDSPYRAPANKGYYNNEDPVSCAAAAKRYGINIEDAYLLLDFHRQ
ncbi:hypothetical protein BKA70DRAFT_1250227 [Coprinopsis sp. MPI-PUGE-AT-0042]|nr:hypothetical protein BKA70DRAFT_1250227 [Coprinopsis sp. MPI-PUGE-AT-0042]